MSTTHANGDLKSALSKEIENMGKQMNLPPFPALALLCSIAFLLYMGYGGMLLNSFFNLALPMFMTIKAIDNTRDKIQWSMYWTIFLFTSGFDMLFQGILAKVPYYFFFRFVFMAWLFLPNTRGAEVLYHHLSNLYHQAHVQKFIGRFKGLFDFLKGLSFINHLNIFESFFGSSANRSNITNISETSNLNQTNTTISDGTLPSSRNTIQQQHTQAQDIPQQQNFQQSTDFHTMNTPEFIKPHIGIDSSYKTDIIGDTIEGQNIPFIEAGYVKQDHSKHKHDYSGEDNTAKIYDYKLESNSSKDDNTLKSNFNDVSEAYKESMQGLREKVNNANSANNSSFATAP